MRGRLGHTIESNTICFRTYKNFGIQLIKNPARILPPAGSQWLYRHQKYYWSLHWNFLTPEQKAAYNELGLTFGITGYDFYIQEKQDPHHLYIHPIGYTWTEKAYPDTKHFPGESVLMCDDVTYEKHMYIKFPLEMLSKTLNFTAAKLRFFYYEESGWDADDKIVDAWSIMENWGWRTITWNTAPSLSGAAVSDTTILGQMQWFEFDVTAAIEAAVSAPDAWFGFMVRFRDLDPTRSSFSGMRATLPHDNDYYPYLELIL